MKVVLADDQFLFLESMRAILENVSERIEVVGVAENGREVLEVVSRTNPDLVLMDVRMPELDGVEATRRLHAMYPALKVVMLTTFEDDEYVLSAMRYGAAGYLLKSISTRELVTAIRAVEEGVVTIDPAVLTRLMSHTIDDEGGRLAPPQWYDALSRKERQILALIVEGYHNREIAARVHVADQTVRNYISRIYSLLGVDTRVAATRVARQSGMFR